MTVITYAAAKATQTETQILAGLLADMSALGCSTVGLSDFSAEMGLARLQARSTAAQQQIRAKLAAAIALVEAARAGDDYLDAVALGRFDETRIPATKTTGTVNITNTTGSTITADARTQVADGAAVLFDNVDGWSIPSSATVGKPFEARTAGIIGNVSAGAIAQLRQGRAGLTIVNPAGWIITAGRDRESNGALILRCLAKWGTLGRGGNLAAYNYLIPTLVTTVTRWRIDDSNPGGPGTVWFWFATEAGSASGPEVAAEEAALTPLKPLGSGAFSYFAAPEHNVAIACELVTDGTNPNAATQAAAALVKLGNKHSMGPTELTEELVKGVLMGGAYIAFELEGFSGVTDLNGLTFTTDEAIATGDVLVITPTITQV